MKNEDFFDSCSESYPSKHCWIRQRAHTREWLTLFPQKLYQESSTIHYQLWDLYIEWVDGTRGRVNAIRLCHKHGSRLWELWGEAGAEEIATSDATERWAISQGGRL